MLSVELVPFVLVVFDLLSLLSLLRLSLHCQFLELISIHFHVGTNYTVCNSSHSSIPMLVLAAMQESLDHDRVNLSHISFDEFLNQI